MCLFLKPFVERYLVFLQRFLFCLISLEHCGLFSEDVCITLCQRMHSFDFQFGLVSLCLQQPISFLILN